MTLSFGKWFIILLDTKSSSLPRFIYLHAMMHMRIYVIMYPWLCMLIGILYMNAYAFIYLVYA